MTLLRLALLALVGASACYQPSPPAGAPCSEDGDACPFGQSCIRGTCRIVGADASVVMVDAFVPDGPPSDLDADGRLNTADNCPNKYNPDQHDEDADGVGDVCDNCPHLANSAQTNTGESSAGATPDAVGDACDPRPNMSGDTIEKFIPFNAPLSNASVSNGWMQEGDSYRYTGDAAWIDFDGVRDRITIELGGSLEQPQTDMYIGLIAGEAGDDYFDCAYYDYGGNPRDFHTALIGYANGNNFQELAGNHEVPTRLTGDFRIRMLADSVANLVTCTTIDSRGTAMKQAGANQLLPGSFSLDVEDGTFRLKYFIVFGQQ